MDARGHWRGHAGREIRRDLQSRAKGLILKADGIMGNDTPDEPTVGGGIVVTPILGGLHHDYRRAA